jgi:hypothetical protein
MQGKVQFDLWRLMVSLSGHAFARSVSHKANGPFAEGRPKADQNYASNIDPFIGVD